MLGPLRSCESDYRKEQAECLYIGAKRYSDFNEPACVRWYKFVWCSVEFLLGSLLHGGGLTLVVGL
jgi:hypothetical protein